MTDTQYSQTARQPRCLTHTQQQHNGHLPPEMSCWKRSHPPSSTASLLRHFVQAIHKAKAFKKSIMIIHHSTFSDQITQITFSCFGAEVCNTKRKQQARDLTKLPAKQELYPLHQLYPLVLQKQSHPQLAFPAPSSFFLPSNSNPGH